MRLLLLLAVVCFVLALVAELVPTHVLGQGGLTWVTAGLLCWAVDALLGGHVFVMPARRG
jgi:hypothetical protein